MRPNHRFHLSALVAAVVLAVAGPVASAQAAQFQYALNRYLGDYDTVSSALALITGGKAQFGTSVIGSFRIVIQTYTGGTLLYTAAGTSAAMTHPAINNVQSRCYWYNTFGPISGTTPVNCWRYQ